MPKAHQALQWYAEGVNAYIAARPRRLGAEFNLLRVRPEPWTPLDSLGYAKMMGWALSLNWESELTRLRLLHGLDPVAAAELDPDYPAQNPIAMEGVGSETVTRLLATAGLLLNQYESLEAMAGQRRRRPGQQQLGVVAQKQLKSPPAALQRSALGLTDSWRLVRNSSQLPRLCSQRRLLYRDTGRHHRPQ